MQRLERESKIAQATRHQINATTSLCQQRSVLDLSRFSASGSHAAFGTADVLRTTRALRSKPSPSQTTCCRKRCFIKGNDLEANKHVAIDNSTWLISCQTTKNLMKLHLSESGIDGHVFADADDTVNHSEPPPLTPPPPPQAMGGTRGVR